MGIYAELTSRGVSTRDAADLVGVPRATATRKPPTPVRGRPPVPANRLDAGERARILAVVNSTRFVDLPPIQIYAQLPDLRPTTRRGHVPVLNLNDVSGLERA